MIKHPPFTDSLLRMLSALVPQLRDEIVSVKPFGDDPNGPVVVVRTSALTALTSLTVDHSREMSPAEAVLVAKALAKAAKIASTKNVTPALAEAT